MTRSASRGFGVDRIVRLVLALAAIAGGIGVIVYANRQDGGTQGLLKANPGWTAETPGNSPVRLDDASGRGDVLKLGHYGGRSGRFQRPEDTDKPASEATPLNESGSMHYVIEARDGSGERTVLVGAYARAGTTTLIFTFRLGSRP